MPPAGVGGGILLDFEGLLCGIGEVAASAKEPTATQAKEWLKSYDAPGGSSFASR